MKLAIRITANTKGSYTAVCPSLPGCVSQGGTQEEAKVKLMEVVRGYLAAVSNFVPDDIECEYRSDAPADRGGLAAPDGSRAAKGPANG
jgi:predicted RNase H-like HicB family nuclease